MNVDALMDSIRVRSELDAFAAVWKKRGVTDDERKHRLGALVEVLMNTTRPSVAEHAAQDDVAVKRALLLDDLKRAKLSKRLNDEATAELRDFTPEEAAREDELDRKAEAARIPEETIREWAWESYMGRKKMTSADGFSAYVVPMTIKGQTVPVQEWDKFLERKGVYGKIEETSINVPRPGWFTIKFL